jgi:uncharacterized membrane protein
MFPILFIVLCLVVLFVVMGPMMTSPEPRRWRDSGEIPHKRAFDILNKRLAKGEIDKSEYDEKHRTIAQGQ